MPFIGTDPPLNSPGSSVVAPECAVRRLRCWMVVWRKAENRYPASGHCARVAAAPFLNLAASTIGRAASGFAGESRETTHPSLVWFVPVGNRSSSQRAAGRLSGKVCQPSSPLDSARACGSAGRSASISRAACCAVEISPASRAIIASPESRSQSVGCVW
jgi:hypothetical protein